MFAHISRGGGIAAVLLCIIIVLITYSTFQSWPLQRQTRQHVSQPKPPSWLLFTSATSTDFQRRLIIRWTWTTLFQTSNLYEHIFAVTSTDERVRALIRKESVMFGDILLLDMEDNEWNANHLKPFEVLKNVTGGGWKNRTYDFVSKVDQDSYVDPVRVWEKYLSSVPPDRLMLSMPHEEFCAYPAPQGGFYTLSWDLAEMIAGLYANMTDRSHISQEDCQVGRFPHDAKEDFTFMSMQTSESFDVISDNEKEQENFYAREWVGNLKSKGSIKDLKADVVFLHQMKEDWKWMSVMNLFDKDGWRKSKSGSAGEIS